MINPYIYHRKMDLACEIQLLNSITLNCRGKDKIVDVITCIFNINENMVTASGYSGVTDRTYHTNATTVTPEDNNQIYIPLSNIKCIIPLEPTEK